MNEKNNRARDKDLEKYANTGFIESSAFKFSLSKKGKERFKVICETIVNNETFKLKTVTFQKGINGEGLTFDKDTIPSLLLQNDTLSLLCENSEVDRAYFLLELPTTEQFLLIVENSRCDCVIYYDVRELSFAGVTHLFSLIEDDYYSQQRQKTIHIVKADDNEEE